MSVEESGVIETYSGAGFRIDDPQFYAVDIARALSMSCRYNGHVKFFYSVAEHSVLVSNLMAHLSLGDPAVGLLHDATEAYLTDVPRPFKARLPDWQAVDLALEESLANWMGFPWPRDPGYKVADNIALCMESMVLQRSRGYRVMLAFPEAWAQAVGLQEEESLRVHGFHPAAAERLWLHKWNQLLGEHKR